MQHTCPSPLWPSARTRILFALCLLLLVAGLAATTARVGWGGARAEAARAAMPALSGTKSVCPSGCDYASLTAAVADIQANGLDGALILELAGSYTSAGETFPLLIPALNGASAANTVTIRPANGASGLVITSADAVATVDLNGASFVTFDGRAGGAGTAKQLTIENTNTAGVALRFINEAGGNSVKYVALKGVTTSATGGVVLFSTTTGASGNDGNTIDNCDIGNGATTPTNGVYSLGSTGTTAQNNSGNTVSNSNIFNFYASGAEAAGVRLDGGNTDWTITGNSFYQTATRTAVAQRHRAIYVNNTSGNNFTVTNNSIGGSQASAGGTAWTTSGTTAAYFFVGIHLNVGTTTPSSVQGNTIKNFVWTSSSATNVPPGVWGGIHVQGGSANIGTITGNTIGSGTGTGSIAVTTSVSGGTTFGIGSTSGGTVNISNNTVGSITTNGTSTTVSASFVGIRLVAGTNTISANTVGSTTTANSLNAATSSTSTTGQQVFGIFSSSTSSATITNNTVANLNNNYAGLSTNGYIRGISTSSSANTITGNTVRNLSTTSANANATTTQSVYGIIQTSTVAGQTVSENVVHSLSNTHASNGVSVTGIYFAGSTTTAATITRNFVHSLSVSSNSATSALNGLQLAGGTFTAQNNMVRVGLDASGTNTAGASIVRGIFDDGTTEGRNFYHNSVYLGGTQTSSSNNTFPFQSTGATNARSVQNNIFVNARANSGGTGKHYAVSYGGSTVNPTGLTANGNIFYVSGTGGVLGFYNSADRTTMQAWRSATGQDAVSGFADPLFVNPTGDASAVDLHLQASNPAEGNVITVAAVADDFDGQTRSTLTPTDIGADAGNFTLSSDAIPPAISYPLLSNGSTANRTLTGFATIADNVGVSGGANSPRLYFKKSTDADVFGGNTSADNGWKYVTPTNATSPYDFTIDYSILSGGSVAGGDTIQYFVVAQDAADNLGSNPTGATASTNPPVQNINAKPVALNSYTINATTLSGGTKTVCASGCDYTSLTGANGIFAAINSAVVTGNIVISIGSDLTEDGTNALNQIVVNDFPPAPYTITIQPDSATMRTISGAAAAGMIRLNGADRVTIDGRSGGAGRFLTFRNTSTSNPTIYLFNDASDNTIRSSVIEGASTGNGVIFIATGATTGNDNNLITENQIRDLSTSAGVPFSLIVSQGTSATVLNSNNTVSNNELFNFTSTAVQINPNSESFTVTGNTIYQTAARTTQLLGIDFTGSGTNQISGNTIRDLNTNSPVYGMRLAGVNNTTVSRNRIYSFPSASGATLAQVGIFANHTSGGTATIVNNQVTLAPSFANAQSIYGIYDAGNAGTTTNVYYNSVLVGGTASGSNSSWAFFRTIGSTTTLRDNIFFNNRTGGAGSHFAAGNQATGGTFSSNYNLFVGTGATTAADFMDSGTSSSGTPVSFAQWQTSTGGDANSSAGSPDATYSTTLFVDPTVGDLHINTGAGAATLALVANAGTPVSGVTTDYDNDTRDATTPDIGSDELTVPGAALNFDGVNDFVTAPALNVGGQTAATFEGWFKIGANAQYDVLFGTEGIGQLRVSGGSGKLYFHFDNLFDNFGETPADSFTPGQFFHVAVVFDGSQTGNANRLKIYINGVLQTLNFSGTIPAALPANPGGTFALMAEADGTRPVDGTADEFRVWNVARTCEEINHAMSCELTGGESGLVAYYKFNQGAAGGNNSGQTTATDTAGGDHNGALNNFALSGATSNWVEPGGVTTGDSCPATVASPDINVKGNGNDIADGDTTPSASDHTDFGSVNTSGGTVARTFTIENTGAGPLNLTGTPKVSISGANASEFTVTSAQPSSPVAANGGTTTFDVTFDPADGGPRTATISIASNDCGENPYDFTIQGAGIVPNTAPSASATPASAQTDEDTPVQITLTGADADDDDLTFTVTDAPDHGSLGAVSAPDCAAADTCTATVTYTPAADYNGADSFKFKAADGELDSEEVTVNITVNAVPDLTISDVTQAEGNSGTAAFTFTVTKEGAGAASVAFATEDDTAEAGSDYASNSGTLNFASGDTTKQVTVNVNGDTTPETDETFSVVLSNPAGADIADDTGTGTVRNDEESVSAGQLIISEFRLRGPGLSPEESPGDEGPTAKSPQSRAGSPKSRGALPKSHAATPPCGGSRAGATPSTSAAVRRKARVDVLGGPPAPEPDTSPEANDEFIELYNNSDSPLLVTTTDGSEGWAVAASDGVVRFIVPQGTVIPPRAHFLSPNLLGYSLYFYPAGDGGFGLPFAFGDYVIRGDGTDCFGYELDIPDNAGIALFRTSNPSNFSEVTRLDAVGSTAEPDALYREGEGYPALTPEDISKNLEHSFFRPLCSFAGSGCSTLGFPKDTGDNASDFLFVDTEHTATAAGQRLGAPGPENLFSPVQRNGQLSLPLLDRTLPNVAPPNRARDLTSDPTNNSTFGTLEIRRRVTNNTGRPVTALRFRIIELSTKPAGPGVADLRARDAAEVTVVKGVSDEETCSSSEAGAAPCDVNVEGTILEQPSFNEPGQPRGGGLNSSLAVGSVTFDEPLEDGASVNVNFLLGVQQTGAFRFLVNIEAVVEEECSCPGRPVGSAARRAPRR